MVASGGVLSEGYGHDGPDVCLGDGQTEAYLKAMGMTGLTFAWAMARLENLEKFATHASFVLLCDPQSKRWVPTFVSGPTV